MSIRSGLRAGWFILWIAAASTGCAYRNAGMGQNRPLNVPVRTEIAGVPFFSQQSRQCGPAALAAVLSWSGSHVNAEELAGETFTREREGTLQPMLVSASRDRGRLTYLVRDFEALLQEVAAGHPVIVLQNLGLRWYPRWHYAVVIGYDAEKQRVMLRSGRVFRKQIDWSLFQRTWNRAGNWGLLALPPHELPASADQASYLKAALSLEEVGKNDEAAMAYKTALRKWPKSPRAVMGLGNSLYAIGDLDGAEETFRTAVARFPACGDAYNNLAHVLATRTRYDEAMDAARKAIRIGGSNASTYRETMEQIRHMKEQGD